MQSRQGQIYFPFGLQAPCLGLYLKDVGASRLREQFQNTPAAPTYCPIMLQTEWLRSARSVDKDLRIPEKKIRRFRRWFRSEIAGYAKLSAGTTGSWLA